MAGRDVPESSAPASRLTGDVGKIDAPVAVPGVDESTADAGVVIDAATVVDADAGVESDTLAPPLRGHLRRIAYLVLAWLALLLAVIGIVLPGLPTTPFVLVAAWAAARGSNRLHAWLRRHRVFGPMIRDWQATGAVSRRAKRAATVAMAACAVLMFATAPRWWMAASGSAVMAIVATWLWRRPEPPAASASMRER